MSLDEREVTALRAWVAAALDEQVVECGVLAEGLNLVVRLATTDDEYVLRRPTDLRATPGFVDTQTEHAVLKRLVSTDVPAPRPVAHCRDEPILGAPFVVTTRLDGSVVPLGSRLPPRYRHPAARERLVGELVDTLATLHTTPTEPFDVCETRSLSDQLVADRERIERAATDVSASFTDLAALGDRLLERAPETTRPVLVHGDYRPGNVLFVDANGTDPTDATEAVPRVAGVLDWETPTLGDPRGELGYVLLRWHDPRDPTPALDGLQTHTGESVPEPLERAAETGLAPFTAVDGCPGRRAVIDRYETRTGRSFDCPAFALAHGAFTLAAVWTTLHSRAGGGATGRLPWIDYLRRTGELALDGRLAV